jgi:hypothetical protein
MVYFERKKKCVWNKLIETEKWINHEEMKWMEKVLNYPKEKWTKTLVFWRQQQVFWVEQEL